MLPTGRINIGPVVLRSIHGITTPRGNLPNPASFSRGHALCSVRHKHRNRHAAQYVASHPAQNRLAQARVAVRPHHDKVVTVVDYPSQYEFGRRKSLRYMGVNLGIEALPHKMTHQVITDLLVIRFGIDRNHGHLLL
jgi:hypothetical protein